MENGNSWGNQDTGEKNLINEIRGSKTIHNAQEMRDYSNKTGCNKF